MPLSPDTLATRTIPTPLSRDVTRAIVLLRKTLDHPLALTKLARHCGVAERTLNEHFREYLGVSPARYHRGLRLAAARDALLTGDSGLSVTKVAAQFGFSHFGRFAAQYRKQFDEPPSATLRALSVADDDAAASRTDRTAPHATQSIKKVSLAVLIDYGSSHEPVLRELAGSLRDAVTAALTSVRSLAVFVPRAVPGNGRDLTARAHGARYVLTGGLMAAGARLRIILRLTDAATGQQLWGDSIEGQHDRAFELQDRVTAAVLRATLPNIRDAEIEQVQRASPRSLDAYGLSMRALPFLFASRPDAARQALELLHRALEFDAAYPLAAALAAWGHAQLVMYNGTPTPLEERRRAAILARQAAILDDDDPLALTARCAVHTMTSEFYLAETLAARALAIDPTSGWAWGRSAWLNSYRGHSDIAIAQFRQALLTDPKPARANDFVGIGTAHFNLGRYEASAAWLHKAQREHPGTVWANRSLSVSYLRIGERLKAKESLEALRRSSPDLTVGQVLAAVPFRPDFLDRLGNGLSDLGLPP